MFRGDATIFFLEAKRKEQKRLNFRNLNFCLPMLLKQF